MILKVFLTSIVVLILALLFDKFLEELNVDKRMGIREVNAIVGITSAATIIVCIFVFIWTKF